MARSIEVRIVTVGYCNCGVPLDPGTPSTCEHWRECDYGRIPSFDINDPAPLIITARDWAIWLLANGGSRRRGNGAVDTITIDPRSCRMFHRIDHHGRSWTWELLPAHWAEKPSRRNNAHMPIYLGRWPD